MCPVSSEVVTDLAAQASVLVSPILGGRERERKKREGEERGSRTRDSWTLCAL